MTNRPHLCDGHSISPLHLLVEGDQTAGEVLGKRSGVVNIGTAVWKLRTDRHISQRELSDRLGLDRNHVSPI